MTASAQDDELIRRTAGRHKVAPELLTSLLSLAAQFENFNIYGARVEFTRAVEQLLDAAETEQNSGLTP